MALFDKEFFEGKIPFYEDGYMFVDKKYRIDISKDLSKISLFYIDTHITYNLNDIVFGNHCITFQDRDRIYYLYYGGTSLNETGRYHHIPTILFDQIINLYIRIAYESVNNN